jgi:hypothetical protein
LKREVKKSLDREALKEACGKSGKGTTSFDIGEKPQEPVLPRFRTNDSSYEKLGELLTGNPNGILVERDELISLLRYLDDEQHAAARGFYLTGWNGKSMYTFDRIGRGRVHVEAAHVPAQPGGTSCVDVRRGR